MPLYHIFILAIIQGLTEFLPISSSGHLVVAHHLLGEQSTDMCWTQNRQIDVAVHLGTLLSVLLYFRRDIFGFASEMKNKQAFQEGLLVKIIIASIPVVIAGIVLNYFQPSFLCMITVMAWASIIFGFLLWFADQTRISKSFAQLNIGHSFMIGLSQALALIPGVSRSGITMTTARFFGFSRVDAARFSLLLSIVAISGAGVLTGFDIFKAGNPALGFDTLIAIALSFISSWVAIALMMQWLQRASFLPFVIYRVGFGVLLLVLIYGNIL